MNVSGPFIRRPVATSLLGLAVMLCGLIGYWLLPVSSLPQVDFPTIQVRTQLPGANPETMASLVTAPLERPLGQIPSLQSMTSTSSFGLSLITLQFELGRDIDAAAQDVQAAINAAASTLPRNLPYPPVYAKVNPADAPVVTLALTSRTYSLRQLSDFADSLVIQRLAEISGVGAVSVQGGVRPAIRIRADLTRLASYGLSLTDLRTAIVAANVSGPKGALDGASQAYTISGNDQVTVADAYRDITVSWRNGAPVLIGDVADIVDGLENDKVAGSYDGDPAVIVDVRRQPGANVVETVEDIRDALPRLRAALPSGVTLSLVHDRTGTIKASIRDVQFTLAVAVSLVVLVVLLFLRSARATLVAGVTLPLSLIATFAVMWLAGFSLDNLSLMALTIGTGFVVDDAIVMIENIVRRIEAGEPPFAAAIEGAREIGFTVISLTASLVAVFIPLLFMTGIVGRMFREFALTLTIAVVMSAVVSLTLTPMLCARLLRREAGKERGGPLAAFDRGFSRLTAAYGRSLRVALRHEGWMIVSLAVTLAATLWLYVEIPKGFMPTQDTGLIVAATRAEPTVSFQRLKTLQDDVAAAVREDPDVAGVVSVLGVGGETLTPNAGRLAIVLRPREQRRDRAEAVMARLQERVRGQVGIRVDFQPVQEVQVTTRASRARYQYNLTGPLTGEVSAFADRLARELQGHPALRDVASEAEDGGARLFVKVDREKAARLGVTMQAVNDAFYDAFGQRQVSTIYAQANQYRVILEADPRLQQDTASLGRLFVPSAQGTQIPLGSIATVERTTAPLVVGHDNQFPATTVSFNLPAGGSLGEAVRAIEAAQARIGLPDGITGRYSGDAAEFERSLAGQPWLILAAVVTIYIVLGVLYESAVHPITILSTLPSAGVGALVALIAWGHDLSLIGVIGIVLLMGIVKKNAIMMIDFALEAERRQGLAPREAILQASLLRFRPIIMTTLAALFGALPLALEQGTGSELRNPLGIAIVGGLVMSQLLTLYTTPALYLTLDRLSRRLRPRLPAPATDARSAPAE